MATVPASHADLIEKNQILIMATNGPNGFPQVTAMWFLHQDGMLRVSLNDTRQKTRNLLNDQKVSLFFVDPENPYRTLEIRAIASADDERNPSLPNGPPVPISDWPAVRTAPTGLTPGRPGLSIG